MNGASQADIQAAINSQVEEIQAQQIKDGQPVTDSATIAQAVSESMGQLGTGAATA